MLSVLLDATDPDSRRPSTNTLVASPRRQCDTQPLEALSTSIPMAATPQVPTVPNTPLLNRYNEDEYTSGATKLPSGPCNYINLSAGGNAPKCGCRRFTDKYLELHGVGGQSRPGWCICEHHSCFHNHDPVDGPGAVGDVVAGGGISLVLKSPMHRQPPTQQDQDGFHDENPEVGRLQNKESLPDTLQWSRYINTGSSLGSLPAIPSQCLLPSDNSSRASNSQAGNTRPFAGLGLSTLSHIPKPRSSVQAPLKTPNVFLHARNERGMQVCEDSAGNPFLQSLTEVATPSLRSSQDPEAEAAFRKNVAGVQEDLQRLAEENAERTVALRPSGDAPESRHRTESNAKVHSVARPQDGNDENLLPRIRSIINYVADYPTKIQNHEQRLDLLENASFSHGPIDEIQENQEHLDTRVGELEGRIDEIEKAQAAQNDASSIGSRQHVASSFDSRMSNTSSALIADAMDRVDYARLEALEAQVAELQSVAPPSHARPWEVEVVFLPFGPQLLGIWSSQQSSTQRSRASGAQAEDITLTQQNSVTAAQTCLTAHDQVVAWETCAQDLGDQSPTWLIPKACDLGSRIYERLRSRGLVKLIQIKGPDARDVHAAILGAFGDLPTVLAGDPYSPGKSNNRTHPKALRAYLGLHASWVPLRKLHRVSRLRFLNTSEMVTAALWTAQFLSSTVVMRSSGTRRLYITQPDGYIQHLGDATASWTWQKLRQLPRVYADAQPSLGHTPEADAHEPCWEPDEHLDPPPSIHSSFASHHSSLTMRPISHEVVVPTSPSDHFSSAAVSLNASTTPTSLAPPPGRPTSPRKERHPFRPVHARTTSMPSLIPVKSSPSQVGKRRIASFDLETQSSPTRTTPALTLKRRRISRSPSRPRDTPRWSVGPPSPYTYVDDVVERKRGTTPFAYATPHSNAPYVEGSRPRSGDMLDKDDHDHGSMTDDLHLGDGYALSDYDSREGHQPDEVWEGVQDEEVDESQTLGKVVRGLRREDYEDEVSDVSSQPSEHPSTQPSGLHSGGKAGFRIHVDEEVDEEAYQTI